MMADLPDEVDGPMMANLPDEMWCYIFDHLDVEELKVAARVCRRWSTLTFSGRRMKRVVLRINNQGQLPLSTNRKYENVKFYLTNAMRTDYSWFRGILLRLRNVQSLEIDAESLRTLEPFVSDSSSSSPVLEKLKELKLEACYKSWPSEDLNWIEIAPYLQSLELGCFTKPQLSIYQQFKEQLRYISVELRENCINNEFLELSFPRLEGLQLNHYFVEENSELTRNFLQRHPHLRQLLILYCDERLITTVSKNLNLLTELTVYTSCEMSEGFFKSLGQLTKLVDFSFRGLTRDRDIFNGCGTIPSLQSIQAYNFTCSLGVDFWNKFLKIAPQISSLTTSVDTPTLHFICENFKNLRNLTFLLTDDPEQSEALTKIGQLPLLDELHLTITSWPSCNVVWPNSNVRCLEVDRCHKLTDEDLLKVPERFPMLKRLTIKDCYLVSVAGINLLHQLIPTCRIDLNEQRFYPLA